MVWVFIVVTLRASRGSGRGFGRCRLRVGLSRWRGPGRPFPHRRFPARRVAGGAGPRRGHVSRFHSFFADHGDGVFTFNALGGFF